MRRQLLLVLAVARQACGVLVATGGDDLRQPARAQVVGERIVSSNGTRTASGAGVASIRIATPSGRRR